MKTPELKFAKTHEWVSLEGEIATVGISDYAIQELTDVVHIELPKVGRTLKVGEEFGEIESVKAVSDLYAPVSGEIVEVNESLESDLGQLSDDPYGKGWVIKLRVTDPSGLDKLMDDAAYQKHIQSQ